MGIKVERVSLPDELKANTSGVTKCGHCGNLAPMPILHQHSQLTIEYDYVRDSISHPLDGQVVELLECPACRNVILRSFYWTQLYPMHVEEIEYNTIFPKSAHCLDHLPFPISKAWQSAELVSVVDANAHGVLIGRVLEMICRDQGAIGETLNAQLDWLADKGRIPAQLAEVAHGIRKLRNIGAHAFIGELTHQDVPLLNSLVSALTTYIYVAPRLVDDVNRKLADLKKHSEPVSE